MAICDERTVRTSTLSGVKAPATLAILEVQKARQVPLPQDGHAQDGERVVRDDIGVPHEDALGRALFRMTGSFLLSE